MKPIFVVIFHVTDQNVLFYNWTQLNSNLIFGRIGSTSAAPEDTHVEQPQLLTKDHPQQTLQDSAFHANFDDKDTFQVVLFFT